MHWLTDMLGEIFSALWAHKMRSFLTMFGIAWGVGSLLLLMGLGEGFRSGQRRSLATIGEDVMFIFGGRVPSSGASQLGSRYYNLTYDDYLSIKKLPHVRNAAPVIRRGDLRVTSDFGDANGQVLGSEPQILNIRNMPLIAGRKINEGDNAERRRVCILGQEMVKTLFPGHSALGATVLINGLQFEVVGLFGHIGRGNDTGANSVALIPFTTMAEHYPLTGENMKDKLSWVNFQPSARAEHWYAKSEARLTVARNHRFDPNTPDAFDDWDSIETAEIIGKISDAMNVFLGAVGLVTLALGAIGVVNIMLVNVGERTREIGLRKALGATNSSILTHFFLEGVIITGLSGLMGLFGAWLLTLLFSFAPPMEGFDLPHIVPTSAILAIGSLSLAGVFAGLYPARQAAKLQPVEALRQE